MLVIAGTGLVMEKLTAFDVPPAGAGLKTVIGARPPLATSEEGMAAVTCELVMKVVGTSMPLKRTTELATKLTPLTTSVNGPLPAAAESGLMAVTRGTGLLTLSVSGLDV